MADKKKVSIAVIKRLPRYYRFLKDLLNADILRISSNELSEKMDITASQVRQDLNCFGGFGQQGYGYNVEQLYNEIGNILGSNKGYKAIIIGAGNMGQALANYSNFPKRGYNIIAVFDSNPNVVGKKIRDMTVLHVDGMENYVKENKVDIAILTVPSESTQQVAEKAANAGIRALWNFSAIDLKLSQDVVVENVHLSDSLMILGYRLKDFAEIE